MNRPTGGRRMAQTETTTRIKQVGTVIVPVTNQDRALEFYVGTLGFEERTDMPFGDGDRWVEVAPPAAATTSTCSATWVALRWNDPTPIRSGSSTLRVTVPVSNSAKLRSGRYIERRSPSAAP